MGHIQLKITILEAFFFDGERGAFGRAIAAEMFLMLAL